MKAIRTPDERFEGLPGYSFEPHYVHDLPGYHGLRGHYVDEGPRDAKEVFLCLHGEPTWSYLYRKMIPVFVDRGVRVIAPDWLGFGRSDKPVDPAAYTFHFHRDYMLELIRHLELQNITLVCQDWGGILGLTLPMSMPERFERLLIMNTALMLEKVESPVFASWKQGITGPEDVALERVMKKYAPVLSDEEALAYAAPYPSRASKAAVYRFPEMVGPTDDAEGIAVSQRAHAFWSERWQGETFMAVGIKDDMLGPATMSWMRTVIRNCPAPLEVPEGGHFVQEHGETIARHALDAFRIDAPDR
ncbi:MAG: haloalkane dehalogenase [Myxococcota bacterium]